MRNLLLTVLIVFTTTSSLWGQGQGNLWFCYTNSVVDFSGNAPVLGTPPTSQPTLYANSFPGYFPENGIGAQMAISDAAGNLLFFMKVMNYGGSGNYGILGPLYPAMPKIFDRNGYSMPNADINAIYDDISELPLIIPHPGNASLYYVFYTLNGGLQYCVVDMTLNNGLGDVVAGEKDVLLSDWRTINEIKLAAVQGCDCIWLVVRSTTSNQYYSYRIDTKGINRIPVVSDCGLLPFRDYHIISIFDGVNVRIGAQGGRLSASKDGTMLATGTRRGIELYDFEKCSGIVKNPRLIDTLPFWGICFSPNGSKVYASQLYPLPYYGQQGEVYQFDLNRATPAAITGSKTLVLSNQVEACWNPLLGCYCDTSSSLLGDLRLGPDNKIYVSNDKRHCLFSISVYPPNVPTNPDHTLHVIHNPDALGMACNPEMDYLKLNTPMGYGLGGSYMKSLMYLPYTVVVPPLPPDTAAGLSLPVRVCFADSAGLKAPEGVSCPVWDNGDTKPVRTVDSPGKYWVNYFRNCTNTTDTFRVTFTPVPKMPWLHYGCPGEGTIHIEQPDSNNTVYEYILHSNTGRVGSGSSASGYRFAGLPAGHYTLQIKSGDCDTALALTVQEYPVPEIVTHPADTLIRYGDSIQLHANGANLFTWLPAGLLDNAIQAEPFARPLQPTLFEVIGINQYGCRDTGYINVRIDYRMAELIPNAFSPNGDGLNDVFKIEGMRYQKIGIFKIFNRFGQEVFSTTNPDQGWDGTYSGKAGDAGTYYYLIQLHYPDGLTKTFNGDVILVR